MAIPKYHDIEGAATHIRQNGGLVNGCSSTFERMMKLVKNVDEGVLRSRHNDGSKAVFTRTVAKELDAAASAAAGGAGGSGALSDRRAMSESTHDGLA